MRGTDWAAIEAGQRRIDLKGQGNASTVIDQWKRAHDAASQVAAQQATAPALAWESPAERERRRRTGLRQEEAERIAERQRHDDEEQARVSAMTTSQRGPVDELEELEAPTAGQQSTAGEAS